jgi:hypothetical protein
LKAGGLVAEHALRAYRDKHRSAMMTCASEAFRVMTRMNIRASRAGPKRIGNTDRALAAGRIEARCRYVKGHAIPPLSGAASRGL